MNGYSESEWNVNGRLVDGPTQPAGPGLPPGPGVWAPQPSAAGVPYGQVIGRHKLLVTCFLLLGALAGTVYVVLKTPEYDAVATVELVGFNQSFMGMNQLDPQAGTDSTTASASNIQTQTKILTSRNLLSRVMERMDLETTPLTPVASTFFTRLHAKLASRLPFAQSEPLAQSKEAIYDAAQSVSARGVGTSRLIEIHTRSTSPQVAADFVNTLTQEHITQTSASRFNVTQKTYQWVESQMEEAKSQLETASGKLREFVQKSGMDFFPEQLTLADSKLRQLQADVSAIQADRIAKQSRWELAKSTPAENLPDVLADANLQSLKTRLSELRAQLAPLTVTLTPENIRVQRIQSQINETEQTLQKEEAALPQRLEAAYQEALRHEKLLLAAYNAQTHSVSGQADKAAQYAMLKRDIELEQQLYNNLLQQSSQAALIAAAPSTTIRVVDGALPADKPANPMPIRDIPIATILGGVLGVGLIVLRENSRRKKFTLLFDAPGRTQTLLGVPELGVIPSAQLDGPKHRAGRLRILNYRSPIEPLAIPSAGENGPVPEFARWQGDKSSLLAESFRQTLVSILRTKRKDNSRVYVISSAGPGEGKTTLSANLAAAMADIGHRVLLIDADLRRARTHNLLGAENGGGLSDILASQSPIEDLNLDDYIRPTSNTKLWMITHGLAEVETPALLFFSSRCEKLIPLLRKRFDCIILDTAPALAFPDARLLGKQADGVVLVVRAGITNREGVAAACRRFQDDGIEVLGTILNDWTPKESGAQGYYSSWYGAYGKRQ